MEYLKKFPEDLKPSDKSTENNFSPCIAMGSEKSKFEQFKADSEYLMEPLASELRNENNHFTNDAVQLLKFHGSYQQDNRENRKKGEEKDWQMMLRLRSPGGRITPALFSSLVNLSDNLGNGTLRATTRQAFQMHGVRKENLKEVIGTIVRSMGSTLAACGDITRNVMAPAAPYEEGGYPAARKLANDIADLLSPKKAEGTYLDLWVDGDLSYRIRPRQSVKNARKKQSIGGVFCGDESEPLYGETYLPRKFKCAVTVPGDNSVDLLTNDIGLVAFSNSKGILQGCNVYIGGGMGRTHNNEHTFARIAEPLGYVKATHVFELVQSILAIQRDYGDRKTRRHSRMKYLLHDQGMAWFKKELLTKYFLGQLEELKNEPTNKLYDYLGWHRQSTNKWFVGVHLLSGRLKGPLKKGLCKIVEKYQLDIYLTPNQDILLANIGNHQKASVKEALINLGVTSPGQISDIERLALACPALPLCGLAITEAERSLPHIIKRVNSLLERLKIHKQILIRVTGCPNGCARPYMAEIGLVGSGVNEYQLWLGGTLNAQQLAKPYLQKMPLGKLEETIEPLLLSWKKNAANKDLGEYIHRIGDQAVVTLLDEGLHAP